jgi:hypothetical protein
MTAVYNETLWSGNYSLFNNSWSTTYNATYDAKVTDNQSWNQTLGDSIYYPLQNNPLGYWNDTYAAFNKTYADTLYTGIGEPLWSSNYSLFNDSWSSTYNSSYLTNQSSLNYSKITNGPVACGPNTFMTYMDFALGTQTCTAVQETPLSLKVNGNLTVTENVTAAIFYGNINASYIQNATWLNNTPYQTQAAGWNNLTNWTATDANKGFLLNTTVVKPACSAAERGGFWFEQGGVGVTDLLWVCMKNSSNSYNWALGLRGD